MNVTPADVVPLFLFSCLMDIIIPTSCTVIPEIKYDALTRQNSCEL